jgi:CRP/FNR family transcriptional regulator, global nitrogen regulator
MMPLLEKPLNWNSNSPMTPGIPVDQDNPLAAVFRKMASGVFPPVLESFDRGKTIFFPGDPAERVYFLVKGAVKLSRVYEAGEEITVALLRENSVFGVLSLITGHRSDRFYHAVAFTPVELLSVPIEQVEKALKEDVELSMLMLQGLSSRILQTEMMIETLAHRDMGSRLVSFLLILCRDFGVPSSDGITVDLKLSHQAIAEAIGSTRVTVTRLLGDLRQNKMISIHRKRITVHNPVALGQQFA